MTPERLAPALFALHLAVEVLQRGADWMQRAGLVEAAGRVRGLAEAVTAEREAIAAEAEKRSAQHG